MSDGDFVQLLRDEAGEIRALNLPTQESRQADLLEGAAQRLSDALDYIDNLERGLANQKPQAAQNPP